MSLEDCVLLKFLVLFSTSWYCKHSNGDVCRKSQNLAEHCNGLQVPGHSDLIPHMALGCFKKHVNKDVHRPFQA